MKHWDKKDLVNKYLEEAEVRVIDRARMLGLLRSYCGHFLGHISNRNILDLGCGDGILTRELIAMEGSVSATLLDGSEAMLEKARGRLSGCKNVNFIHADFQDLVRGEIELPEFHMAVSALAIHHLPAAGRRQLFQYVYRLLLDGGCFVNIDLAFPSSKDVEDWYVAIWKEWMIEKQAELDIESDYQWVVSGCLEEEHYRNLDTLENQLNDLITAGFMDVDCFYKHGLFVMYGGRKL